MKGDEAFDGVVSMVARTHRDISRLLVRLMANEGFTGIVSSHGDILIQLFEYETMSMAQIAEAIGRDPSTVTALVKKLITAGYVEKKTNPLDRRIKEVELTEQGKALMPAFERVLNELIQILLRSINISEMAVTYRVLTIIQNNVEEYLS